MPLLMDINVLEYKYFKKNLENTFIENNLGSLLLQLTL